MIFCKELNQSLGSKEELFAALKANKDKIIGIKKATVKRSDPVHFNMAPSDQTKEIVKSDPVKIGDTMHAVINTTNFLDSHGDVHIDGIWDQSVSDQKDKLYYIVNHDLEIGKVIAYPGDNEAMVKQMYWSDLGKGYTGTTQALIFKFKITNASNSDAVKAFQAKAPIENSVRMQYVKMQLAINDTNPDYKDEYAAYCKYCPMVANKEQALEQGYFWAVTEAKIFKEGSAVLEGSNPMTPMMYDMKEPLESTQVNNDPQQGSQLTHTIFDYLN